MIRRLPLTFAVAFILTGSALAQSSVSPEQQAACAEGFAPLRRDAEQKGALIRAASERHALPAEACELISSYAIASAKMIKYVEANAAGCSIPASFLEQLKAAYQRTDSLRFKVCAKVEPSGRREGPARGNDFGDPAFPRGAF